MASPLALDVALHPRPADLCRQPFEPRRPSGRPASVPAQPPGADPDLHAYQPNSTNLVQPCAVAASEGFRTVAQRG